MIGTLLGLSALAIVAASGVLWFRRAMQVRLPANRSGFVAAWVAGLLLGILALVSGPGWVGGPAALLALLGAGFFCLTVAVSRQVMGEDAISVGDVLPAGSALDEHGVRVDIARFRGRPLLLKFFRGHW